MADDGELAKILARKRPRRRWGRSLLLVLLLAGAGAGGWYVFAPEGQAAGVRYTTEAAQRTGLTVTIAATGTVEPTTQVEISSELSGTVAAVEVDFNDSVTVGQVLARLDDVKAQAQVANSEAAVVAARARVASSEASLREASENLVTQEELDRRGVTARTGMASIRAAHERALADLDIARADLTLAEANLALDKADLAKSVIRAPINGVVLSRDIEAGQTVASSLEAPTLFTLAEDLARMRLLVAIDEADIGRLAEGNRATFTVDAHDGRDFPAEVTQVRYAPLDTEGVVTYTAVLAVENPEGLLRPGMTATATIVVAEEQDALTVPNAALRFAPPVQAQGERRGAGLVGLVMPQRPRGQAATASGQSVWVLRAGQPVEVKVQRGATDGRRTVVTSPDLAEGDQVILGQLAGG